VAVLRKEDDVNGKLAQRREKNVYVSRRKSNKSLA
jgi:hypothetical protein